MKKKLLVALTSLLALAGLAACGNSYSDKVLAHEDASYSFHAVGGFEGTWAAGKDNKMEATSIKAVSELDKDVANLLNGRKVKYLYQADVELGKAPAGWTSRCKKDSKIYVADGCYTVKSIMAHFDSEEQTFITDQWISDPKTAHCESLTPKNLFFPTWQEEADADGFAWDQNPVCIGGAGVYKLVVATYDGATASKDVCNYGMALILKEAKTAGEGVEWKEEVPWVAKDHTYGVIGLGGDWNNDKPLAAVAGEEGKYSAQVAIAVGDSFKVRADGKWEKDWGFSSLKEFTEGTFEDDGGNIKCKVAGTYTVTISNFTKDGTAKLSIK